MSQAEHYNRDKESIAELYLCTPVQVQNEATGLWELTGVILFYSACPHCWIRLDLYSHRVDKCTLIIRCWTQWASKAPVSPAPSTSLRRGLLQMWLSNLQTRGYQNVVLPCPLLRQGEPFAQVYRNQGRRFDE